MQPTPYTPQNSFATLPAAAVEFNNLSLTISQILSNLAIIQRDDTELNDLIVKIQSLSSEVLELIGSDGFVVRGAWVTTTNYILGDVVSNSGNAYLCVAAHTSGTFATDLAAGRWTSLSANQASLISFTQTGVGAVPRSLQSRGQDRICIQDFGWVAGSDNTTAWQLAINAAAGRPIYDDVGGMNIITSMLTYITTSASVLVQGLQIICAGERMTQFDNRVANGPMLSIDTNTGSKFQQGIRLYGFGIVTTTNPANSIGIQIRRCFQVDIEHVDIAGMSSDGIRFEVNQGDPDGSVNCTLRHCHISGCLGWGVNDNIGAGLNELSILVLEHSRVESCGTASGAATPPSGGIKWRGQIVSLRDGGCVTNENTGLYVVGGAGLGNTLTVERWAFENNKKGHCVIEGIDNFAFRNIQLFSNDGFPATYGIKMDGTSSAIRNGIIDGVEVRATSGNNPYSAFVTTGANCVEKTIVVKRVSWADFDHAGQTRYNGNMIRQEIIATADPILSFSTPGNQNIVYAAATSGWFTRDEDGWIEYIFNIITTTFTHTTASGPLQITNLPFTSENNTDCLFEGSMEWEGVTKANYTQIVPRISPNSSTVSFQLSGSGQTLADLSSGDHPSGTNVTLRGQIRYRSA